MNLSDCFVLTFEKGIFVNRVNGHPLTELEGKGLKTMKLVDNTWLYNYVKTLSEIGLLAAQKANKAAGISSDPLMPSPNTGRVKIKNGINELGKEKKLVAPSNMMDRVDLPFRLPLRQDYIMSRDYVVPCAHPSSHHKRLTNVQVKVKVNGV